MESIIHEEFQQLVKALEPQRNLRNNFNIDLSKELNQYSKEIENFLLRLDQEDGHFITVNFSHAALMIQNSTTVYHRKVEYLHKLAYEALEKVLEKRNKPKYQVGTTNTNYEDFFNMKVEDIFKGEDYVDASDINRNTNNQQNIEDNLIPEIPVHLLSKEVEMNILPLNNNLLDKYGNTIGNTFDFMMNNFEMDFLNNDNQNNVSYQSVEMVRREEIQYDNDNDLPSFNMEFNESFNNDYMILNKPFNTNNYDENELILNEPIGIDNENNKNNLILQQPTNNDDDENMIENELEFEPITIEDIELNQLLSNKSKHLDPHQSIPTLEMPLNEGAFKAVINTPNKKIPNVNNNKHNMGRKKAYYHYSGWNKNPLKRVTFPELQENYEQENKKRLEEVQIEKELNESLNIKDKYNSLDFNMDYQMDFDNEIFNDNISSFTTEYENNNNDWVNDAKFNGMKSYLEEALLFENQMECKLTKKVKNWDIHVKQLLDKEKKETVFNLSKYQNNIMDWMDHDLEPKINFNDKFQDGNNRELARYFLASLHLAQDQKINFEQSSDIQSLVVFKC